MKDFIKKILSMYIVRYGMSSVFAFVINYALLLSIEWVLEPYTPLAMEIGMIVGWLVSSNVNFYVNRKLVFRDDGKVLPAYIKYYALALPVFIAKSFGFIELFTRICKLPTAIASPVAEAVMVIATYLVQKLLVFKNKRK